MAVQCSTHDDEMVLLTVIPAALVESTFTNMLLPTIDLSTVVTPGTFDEFFRRLDFPVPYDDIRDELKTG